MSQKSQIYEIQTDSYLHFLFSYQVIHQLLCIL